MNKELEALFNQVFYAEGDGGGSNDPAPEQTNPEDDSTDKSKESDPQKTEDQQVFKSFKSEDEYNKALQSERSKAKNEVLKELGVDKVEDAKNKVTSTDELAKDLQDYKSRFEGVEQELALTKVGVKDEYKDEALTLAKSKMKDGKSLSDALGEVVKKMPSMAQGTETPSKVGSKKGEGNKENSSEAFDKKMKQKYPWLNL